MSETIEYRYLRATDYDDIVRVWNEAKLDYRPRGRDNRENLTAELRRSPRFSLGAFAEGKLIGTIVGTCDGRKGCINRLAVTPEYRSRDIAKKLISLCEKELKAAGAKVLFCLIEDDNQTSIKLFEKAGYLRGDNIVYLSKRDHPDL
ncbi:MAG: GNAT family N-acetyltransferase [candidate division Zixibacteria bacterium]|nr:GNAT family N-acetyltransferase [candidate division Zixibacteria bacterium]